MKRRKRKSKQDVMARKDKMVEAKYLDKEVEIPELLMNGQKVILKTPGTDYFADFLRIGRDIAKSTGKDDEDVMSLLTDSSLESLQRLVNGSLEKSFPKMWEEDRDELKEWGMKNGMAVMMAVLDMCMPQAKIHEARKKEELLKKITNK